MDNAPEKSVDTAAIQLNTRPSSCSRLAIVSETFPPEVNGVANTLFQLTKELRKKHSIQVIHPKQSGVSPIQDGLEHILVPGCPIPGYSELRFGFPCQKRLQALWQENRPDAVYVATQGPLGWSAVSAARKLDIPVSSGFHTNFHQYSRHYRMGWLSRLIGRYFTYFHQLTRHTLVPTRQTASALDSMGIKNTCIWSRGVDSNLFNPERRSEARRRQWGADATTPVFIYVGRLANEKNVYLALSAFERAQQQASHTKMVLVGGGPLQEKIARQYPNVILAGVKKGESLAEHYASADIFLFPSLTDTFGNVILEAMASGLGIVSFNEAAARELLHHDESALLAPSGNSDLFCQHALSIAMRPSLLTRLRQNAHQQSIAMDWQPLAQQFAHLLLNQEYQGVSHENAKRLRAVSSSR
ncbi:glycosyltransferase family 4 protein [Hahella ganghwensis]|uniref:glycosyltransferase family 4 protein n=1 Tax=Hahella ganghwensis TaxID=286420 RepID=UPI00038047FF|nr:glycosyltransferase family 1 protein [Hahella ganghwensis]